MNQREKIEKRWNELAPLFEAASGLDDLARQPFIANIADPELRDALLALLDGINASSALDGDSGNYAAKLLDPSPGLEGRQLGAWRVRSAIGSGGMATVFLAERNDGTFEQTVAIKVLRHGLHDAFERERFLRERQLLARLDHPDIARVFDGGLTEEGVPWFALEWVDGIPITEYCDTQHLNIDQRLTLFTRLCAAVDYAHRNLIVHRDLKPSNVLVTRDGHLKLLDFGIAKLLDDSMREDATATELRRLTPAYAAPEQASGGIVTTAADVYALGVLLHELLTGERPRRRDDQSLRSPSSLITGTAAQAIAASRATSARALRRRLNGELDLILALALDSDATGRYVGAAALADDIDRHRSGRPVLAKPDAAMYRLRKFAGRHRRAIGVAAIVLFSLVAGIAATHWQATQAHLAAQRADITRDFVLSLFEGVTPDETRGREISARELLDRGARRLTETLHRQPELHAQLASQLGSAYRQLGAFDRAMELAEQARDAAQTEQQRSVALLELGRTKAAQGAFDQAESNLREALLTAPDSMRVDVQLRLAEVLSERADKNALSTAMSALAEARSKQQNDLIARAQLVIGGIHFRESRLDEARESVSDALRLRRELHAEAHTLTAQAEHDLGVIALQQGQAKEAVELFEQALQTRRSLLGQEHPDVADSAFNLGTALRRVGEAERGADLIREAVAMQRKLLGEAHPAVASGLNSLALIAYSQADIATAITHLEDALKVARGAYGDAHPTVVTMLNNLAAMQRSMGRLDAAETSARAAVESARQGPGDQHYLTGIAQLGLGSILVERGQHDSAVSVLRSAHSLVANGLGAEHQDSLLAQSAFADALRESGQLDEAASQSKSALLAAEQAYPASHPRLGKIRLIAARVDSAQLHCDAALPQLDRAVEELSKGGHATRSDLAWATLEQARCWRAKGEPDRAERMQASARELISALPYVAPGLLKAASLR
jgi:tetratricopeptide (TPR) repeat protein